MKLIHAYLRTYASLHELMYAWIVLAVRDLNVVFDWRLQAEEAQAAAKKKTDDITAAKQHSPTTGEEYIMMLVKTSFVCLVLLSAIK